MPYSNTSTRLCAVMNTCLKLFLTPPAAAKRRDVICLTVVIGCWLFVAAFTVGLHYDAAPPRLGARRPPHHHPRSQWWRPRTALGRRRRKRSIAAARRRPPPTRRTGARGGALVVVGSTPSAEVGADLARDANAMVRTAFDTLFFVFGV